MSGRAGARLAGWNIPSGTTGVDRNTPISITFSEWLSPEVTRKSVTLFPPPPKGYDVAVQGKKVTIQPLPAFAGSTTYHCEINSGCTDLRGNALNTPVRIIFSTGNHLDSGSIAGCVLDPQHTIFQPKIALFKEQDDFPDTTLFTPPSYLAQTDSTGRFSLAFLGVGSYRILAFIDDNGDNLFQPGTERCYTPPYRTIDISPRQKQVHFYPVDCDTTTLSIHSFRPVSLWAGIGRLNRKPVSPAWFDDPSHLHITAIDSTINAPRIDSLQPFADSLRFIVWFSDTLTLTGYRLISTIQPLMPVSDTIDLGDTLRFNGITTEDTIPPAPISLTPNAGVPLLPRLTLLFSEPVRFRPQASLLCTDTTGDTLPCTIQIPTHYADSHFVTFARRLTPGMTYRITIPDSTVFDCGGVFYTDTSADTLSPRGLVFHTIVSDDLCYTLAGKRLCNDHNPMRYWTFHYIAPGPDAPVYTRERSEGFLFDSIPGGRGTLGFFEDANNNTIYDRGSLFPWRSPEPLVRFRDTLEARPRWDINGFTISRCSFCEKTTDRATNRKDGAQ